MRSGFLRVKGNKIVDENDKRVFLRGTALGGWLCMENFHAGYPGTESAFRAALLDVPGQTKYDFFFERYFHYFFTDADAAYLASLGLNTLRLPFRHKLFDDDMNPRNPDWHSDNNTSYAAFWDFKDHQDRTVWLWERIAERYKDNPWVAGYNLLNEPCDPQQVRLPALYARLEAAIRAIDSRHILFLDGNTFAMEWSGFTEVLSNASYAIHDYSMMGFRLGGRYTGIPDQKDKLRRQLVRKCEFHHRHGASIWNGEFGPQWEDEDHDVDGDALEVNACRAALLAEQIHIYQEVDMDWSIWAYKDIGRMGMVRVGPDTPWAALVGAFARRKVAIQIESASQGPCPPVDGPIDALVAYIDSISPTANAAYPPNWNTKQHVLRNTLQTYVANTLCAEFAELFRGKTEEELEALAGSFAFEKCLTRKQLHEVLGEVLTPGSVKA
ncbi:glycoside hydrolase superfamily [Plectosphaerella plurivora]|uniref:Glycoside hydrolase superfamily n=1 Tax=Plectosphaerella plurivora TaxID=936078 RepID=A0A9P8VB32_9PEZI|nr:glycoside hydrolase superfamily [Plectosphaerella plurivora]